MSSDHVNAKAPEHSPASAGPPDARIVEITTWLGQFSRTLKTCRLYDARNPTVLKFREDLAAQMVAILQAHGPFRLEFSAHAVACDGHAVLTSRAREDNFAMPFYRDGLRTLTFTPDAEPRELDELVDLLLRVTSRANNGIEDLVTLLWDADLPHLDMTYVASETDTDFDDEGAELLPGLNEPRTCELMPWPSGGGGGGDGPPGAEQAKGPRSSPTESVKGIETDAESALDSATQLRSEDWLAGDPAQELEENFLALDESSAMEVDRFMADLQKDRSARLVPATLELVRDALRSNPPAGDRPDLADLLLRALNESIGSANWADARDAVDCLTECTEGEWDATSLVETLSHPESVVTSTLVRYLDTHTIAEVQEFVAFARTLGTASIEWLMGIVAVATHQRTRRTLVRALSELCEGNPERLAPWLADERWYVVRNAVLVVGATEGGAPAGLLRPLVHHQEPRVRHEVVAALENVEHEAARPLLLEMIKDTEPSIRSTALRRLGSQRDPQASAALLELVLDPGFRKRPAEEVRSVTSALAGCAGEEALPHLEEQLYAPHWFTQGAGPYCQAIARCIARIGTPKAIAILEQGARSRTPATRDACKLVLKGTGHA